MTSDAFESSNTWSLAVGESRLLHAAAGSRWTAARGMLRVTEPPRWLGERVTGRTLLLHEGESHVVDAAGWVMVHAADAGTLQVQSPVSSSASMIVMLLRWLRPDARRTPAASF